MSGVIQKSLTTDYWKKRMEDYRNRVYAILGGKCIRCGEANPLVLTIDHIEPCGNEKTGTRKQTVTIYNDILKNPQNALYRFCQVFG